MLNFTAFYNALLKSCPKGSLYILLKMKGDDLQSWILKILMNIPDKFPSAVRQYGNHFLDSLLCILNHNFYRNIRKGCYAPQMRQGLDKYSHRNGTVIKHKKGDFRVPELWFPNFRIRDFEPQEYSQLIEYSGFDVPHSFFTLEYSLILTLLC